MDVFELLILYQLCRLLISSNVCKQLDPWEEGEGGAAGGEEPVLGPRESDSRGHILTLEKSERVTGKRRKQ